MSLCVGSCDQFDQFPQPECLPKPRYRLYKWNQIYIIEPEDADRCDSTGILLVGLVGKAHNTDALTGIMALTLKYMCMYYWRFCETILFWRISHFTQPIYQKHNNKMVWRLQNYEADVAKSGSPSEVHGILSHKEVQRRRKKRNNVQGQVLNKLGPFSGTSSLQLTVLYLKHMTGVVHYLKRAATWQANTILYQYL